MKSLKFIFLSLTFLFALSITQVEASHDVRAWAWYDQPTKANFTPSSTYQYNSKGGTIKGKRLSTGYYQLTFPNIGASYAGACQAVAYGGNHSVQVQNWEKSGNNLVIKFRAFDKNGRAIDGKFVAFFYKGGGTSFYSDAYMWANQPGNPSSIYQYNTKGVKNKLKKIGTGKYIVTFPRLKALGNKKGTVLVTPYGKTARRAQIQHWSHGTSGVTVTVNTYDFSGRPADAMFVASYISDFLPGQAGPAERSDYGAYVWANQSASANYTPSMTYQDINTTRKNVTIKRLGEGYYKVTLPSIKFNNSTMAIACSYGRDRTYATVERWYKNSTGGTDVFVRTYAPNGRPCNSMFTMFYYTNQNILH